MTCTSVRKNIQKDILDKERILSILSLVSRNIYRMEDYVSKISSIHRLEEYCLKKSVVNLDEFTEKVRKNIEMLCSNYGKKLKINSTSGIVSFDENLILQVVDNLLENGLKHCKSEVLTDIFKSNNMLCITISDDGSGFSKEALDLGFKAFYKEKSSSGLGLRTHNM